MKFDFNYRRRQTWPVKIGTTTVGASNPIRLQSMTSTNTLDVAGSVTQVKKIVDAGGEIVRLTAQGVREAESLGEISARLREEGLKVPLVADIHFNPSAAFAAASRVDKVRINPGNFVDPGRVFKTIDYTEEEYNREIKKIDETLVPLLDICKAHSTALRIGVNHGSLSDRIMSRYGDTPAGMVESAMEFLRVCLRHDFRDVVISIKASNVLVMVETVRLLVAAMDAEDMHFPLHLGVTEAGDAEDGRVKSAVGIGSLLAEGVGDTIRVSLSEDPEREIEPARLIVSYMENLQKGKPVEEVELSENIDTFRAQIRDKRRKEQVTKVYGLDFDASVLDKALKIKAEDGLGGDALIILKENPDLMIELSSDEPNALNHIKAFMYGLAASGLKNPVVITRNYGNLTEDETVIASSIEFGSLLLDGFIDGIRLESDTMTRDRLNELALSILQATRRRITKTEYISCPGCGRTLYDLQSTLRDIKSATSHLKGLKIGVMGCIVNGPGEMADADYGYVGAAAGKISLYKGKECIEKNLSSSEAIEHLVNLIKSNGDWIDPEQT